MLILVKTSRDLGQVTPLHLAVDKTSVGARPSLFVSLGKPGKGIQLIQACYLVDSSSVVSHMQQLPTTAP